MGGDLGLLMAACSERLVRAFLTTLAEAGYNHLTSTQAIAVLLVGDGANTVTQLADRLGITTQAVSKICGVLYTEGSSTGSRTATTAAVACSPSAPKAAASAT